MTTKEHLSKHDREIAEIRAIPKRTDETLDRLAARAERTDEIIAKMAATHAREAAEI
jgi:hypothetical protein